MGQMLRVRNPENVPTSASRRMFRWEDDLRESFRAHSDSSLWCRLPGLKLELTFEESTCSNGRADLVWAAVARGWPRRRRKEVASLLRQPTCSRILAALKPRSPRTTSFLFRRTGVGPATFRASMRRLLGAKLVSETEKGSFVLGPSFPGAEVEFCAFEFKLDDWKRAFQQALRYRTFSHRVFVVMPLAMVDNLNRQVDRFRRFNVGLIAHNKDGRSTTVLRPRKRLPTSRPSFIRAVGELIASR